MILVVSGGRDTPVTAAEFEALDRFIIEHGVTALRVGCCPTGVDAAVRKWAEWQREAAWSWEQWSADWFRHGGRGGPLRNKGMVRGDVSLVRRVSARRGAPTSGRPADTLIHWPGGRGTASAVNLARAHRLRILPVADVVATT